MKWNPAAFRMRGWLELYDFSAEVDHPVWSVSRYLDFLGARLASELVLESVGGEGWTARATVVGDTLRVDLPRSEGWRFELDGRAVSPDDISRGRWTGLVLAPGDYRLAAHRDGSRP